MAAIAAAANRLKRGIGMESGPIPVAAVLIPKGALVCINTAGFATNGADTASFVVAGIAKSTVDNSGGAAGDKSIICEFDAEWLFGASSITQAMVGQSMFVVDNNTVDDAAGPTNDVRVGPLTQFVSTTLGWVRVPGLSI